MERPIEQIDPNKWYKPSEIAEEHLIENVLGKPSVQYIRALIRKGKLGWQNYATGEKDMKYYRVLGSEIIRFRQEREKQYKY